MSDEIGGDNRLIDSAEEAAAIGLEWGADTLCLMGQRESGAWEIIDEEAI